MGRDEHGWRGRGKVRAGRIDGALIVRLDRLTTRAGRFRPEMAAFFRKDYPAQRPAHGPFEARLWLVGAGARLDVDNVAKGCLDALTGAVWHDDAQVARLIVEKVSTAAGLVGDAVVIAVRPLCAEPVSDSPAPPDAAVLEALLARLDAMD